MPEPVPPPAGALWRRRLLGPWTAGVVLVFFWVLMVASLRDKSLTFDEAGYATAGYVDWVFKDYRLQPESGQLPQRVIGLPLAFGSYKFPATDTAAWHDSRFLELGRDWFYQSGNDAVQMAARGRAAAGLFAVALGALVWAWSRRLFGPVGGMLSLLLYVLSPTVLANGALMTSDMAVALFFAGAIGALWRLMQRITPGRLAVSALLSAGLVVAKISALLILPMAALLVIARLADGRPLPMALGAPRELTARSRQALALALAAALHVAVVIVVVWSVYGFRYSAFAGTREREGRFALPWEYVLKQPGPGFLLQELRLTPEQAGQAGRIFQAHGLTAPLWLNPALDAMDEIRRTVLAPAQQARLDELRAAPALSFSSRTLELLRRHELMPEAWIYGLADVLRRSQWRSAFFNGDFSTVGWPAFFPYTFLVKTPLAVFGVLALALGAVIAGGRAAGSRRRWFWSGLYATLPLWVLLAVYCAVTLTSHLNIGHRHLLPLYGPLFVLCGVAGAWLESGRAHRAAASVLLGLMGVLAVEVLARYPNYLAYFNGLVRPASAYRHLVDSSLDWGQDLPAAKAYIEAHPAAGPYYLSYFGMADPGYHGVKARPLFSYLGMHLQARPDFAVIPLTAELVAQALPRLQQQRPDYNLITVNRTVRGFASVWLKKPAELRLAGGTYLISASMLQPVYYDLEGPWGPWNERHEQSYQQLYAAVKPLLGDDPAARDAALTKFQPGEWPGLLLNFEQYRLARLTAALRQREPDDTINYSILVYRLTDAEVARALDGPPPGFGPDRVKDMLELPAAGLK